ncbi:MAG: 3-phosphoshikimate 1-carboxyvinyltransferase [Candidatus Lokiarchaeota archaeon]|nr:3-phosphoshikimate 1-carboxyvinyltransferase [Candidatus Lokiarchaeota archaeon]
MDTEIYPLINSLRGEIIASGSKSYSHRAFIAASLAEGISVIKNPITTGDAEITIKNLRAIGVKIIKSSNNSYIVKRDKESFNFTKEPLDCGNSGTTLRIFCALSLLIKGGLILTGDFLKRKRPIIPLLDALKILGAKYALSEENVKIKRKKILCNQVKIPGNISSQFITALLVVCPLLTCKDKDFIEIQLTTPLVSTPYVKITLDVLNTFGIHIRENFEKGNFYITNEQHYRAQSYDIPGDFSSSAFIIAAAVLSNDPSKIIINNLSMNSHQGDKKIVEILKRMGANIEVNEAMKQIIVIGDLSSHPLNGMEIDCNDIPDLFPILSVVGAFAKGKTVLFDKSKHLRLKESDRISSMARELTKMGVNVSEEDDRLTIYHCDKLKGAVFNHEDDHRIAMACTIAALNAISSSKIRNIDIVRDSYPSFFDDLEKLGAQIKIL